MGLGDPKLKPRRNLGGLEPEHQLLTEILEAFLGRLGGSGFWAPWGMWRVLAPARSSAARAANLGPPKARMQGFCKAFACFAAFCSPI